MSTVDHMLFLWFNPSFSCPKNIIWPILLTHPIENMSNHVYNNHQYWNSRIWAVWGSFDHMAWKIEIDHFSLWSNSSFVCPFLHCMLIWRIHYHPLINMVWPKSHSNNKMGCYRTEMIKQWKWSFCLLRMPRKSNLIILSSKIII